MTSVRSLPPLVDGDVFGSLAVTVDEVLWSKKYSGEIIALLQWWGDSESVSLRPSDITKYPESSKDNTTVTYDIKTNLALFQTYLKQCSKIRCLLVSSDTKDIVGHVTINDLNDHITGVQHQQYFPITTACGDRIGDLRVRFNLSMNSVTDGMNKKMKKRSRKKNKTTNNDRSSADDEKPKQLKTGCKTCSGHKKKPPIISNPSTLEFPKPFDNYKVPPNTGRSDSSEYTLLDVLEKGKKLRDAMVLSVLDDADDNFDEKLLLKLDEDKDSIGLPSYKELIAPTKMDLVSKEEKLINDYLNGKAMKEEDEVMVLNTLHSENNENEESSKLTHPVAETKPPVQVQESCCLSQASCAHFSARTASNPTESNLTSAICNETNVLAQKINCFRVTVESLTLTSAGWKKINNSLENRCKYAAGEVVQPTGTTYFVECHFADDSPRSQAQPWKSNPLRFCSRRQIENVVYFGQSGAQALRAPHGAARAEAALGSGRGVVCWRHLTRPLALLGQFTLSGVLRRGCVEASVSLPITPEGPPGPPTAHLRLTVQLGRDKLYFGPALFEDPPSVPKENKAPSVSKESGNKTQDSEVHVLSIEDLRPEADFKKVKTKPCKKTDQSHASARDVKLIQKRKSGPRSCVDIDIPTCTNCSQNLTGTICQNPGDNKLCVSCSVLLGSHKSVPLDPKFDLSGIPPELAAKDQRHHEFLIKIDTVIGFPLFSAIQEELSCYVDYKFPEVMSNLKVEMARRETTSRVVACESQPSLASVGRHGLSLPVALPLSPLLAASAPGITLRLWLRYFKPTPRDHMVALALLPMDELCLMELEFDRKTVQTPVVKVLDLPLALVPSSVTAPYHHYQGLGTIRVTVTYSNQIRNSVSESIPSESTPRNVQTLPSQTIPSEPSHRNIHTLPSQTIPSEPSHRNIHPLPSQNNPSEPSSRFIHTLPSQPIDQARGPRPIEELLSRLTNPTEDDLRLARNRFWTGPFGNQSCNGKSQGKEEKIDSARSDHILPEPSSISCVPPLFQSGVFEEPSRPVLKQDFDNFAENLEQKFNKLQSELLKERQRALVVDSVALNNIPPIGANDFMAASLSSNSSADSLPFVLGPPANFKDLQNTKFADNKAFSDSQSEKSQGTISGFLKEEKSFENFSPNKPDGKENLDINKPQTFRATVKIDRAVNLKAVKVPSNGKKGKIPPSTWVSFGTGDCCEQNCGSSGPVCSSQRYATPIIRRNYNPIWNLAWDMDLPLEYLKQVNKRLVFRVFEENLDGLCFGTASANLSILTSGLPCLSSWLSINDLAGSCKGQIKIAITPLEDLSKYQETSVFDGEEDEFAELKEDTPEPEIESFQSPRSIKTTPSFIASQSEVFVNDKEEEKEVESPVKSLEEHDSDLDEADGFSADDVISNYRSTLENNFRNEMAGLENLIKFLRVGTMGNGLSFMSSNENKENLSSNPVPTVSQPNVETRNPPTPSEVSMKCSNTRNTQMVGRTENERKLIDASTETSKETTSSSEDVLQRLLQQIVSIQPPAVKITDNTCQTVVPETREICTETNDPRQTVQMRDASTETRDISESRTPQSHVCGELGSVLLQHFLTCRPGPVKVTDNSCQTIAPSPPLTNPTTAQSSFLRSQPSGASEEMVLPNQGPGGDLTEQQTNCDRLTEIDNNLKDLERFLKENLLLIERDTIPPIDSDEGSFSGSVNGVKNSFHGSELASSHSQSELESLENYSQETVFPRETPDGGSTEILSVNSNAADDQRTTLKRRGTFTIDKSNIDGGESRTNSEMIHRDQEK